MPRHTFARASLAALLLASSALASAASFTFTGSTDAGPLAGQSFSGSFSFDGPVASADGDLPLTAFELSFAGQTWQLAQLDVGAVAVFSSGQALGLALSALPTVSGGERIEFVPGFTDFSAAHFAYKTSADELGFGSYTLTDVTPAVPEPASVALLLAGLGVVGLRAVRRG